MKNLKMHMRIMQKNKIQEINMRMKKIIKNMPITKIIKILEINRRIKRIIKIKNQLENYETNKNHGNPCG